VKYAFAVAVVLYGLTLAPVMRAELTPWGSYIPRRAQPPVIFITGHDAICPDARSGEIPFFELTFGKFDKVINESGRVAMVFELCYAPNRPGLDIIATRFGEMAARLRYEDGERVPEIDVVAHNIGGLMLRSYIAHAISGPRIRKAVFIGVPHFGTNVAAFTDRDPQLRQISLGSRWLFQLATWNQGHDDLRGADAIALTGTAGINIEYGPTDSVVAVTSASLDFISPGRTVTLPLCHTQGGIGQLFLCDGAAGIASVRDAGHPTARVVLAFLDGMADDSSGAVPGPAPPHVQTAGVMVERRTAWDQPVSILSASVATTAGTWQKLAVSTEGLAFSTNTPAGAATLYIDGQEVHVDLAPGGSRAVVVKPGPFVSAVHPYPGASWPLALAPGMLVRIEGRDLGDSTLTLGGQPVRVISTATDGSLVAVLPDIEPGDSNLIVRTASGQHKVGVTVQSAAPAFLRTKNGSVAGAIQAGNVLTVYLTGLGAARPSGAFMVHVDQPSVTVGGQPCEVMYSGRAAAMPGVDQINCRLSAIPADNVDVAVHIARRQAHGSLQVRPTD